MVHIPFDTRTVTYDDHFFQIGAGGLIPPEDHELVKEPLTYFHGGSTFQRGYGRQTGAGIGDVLRGIWRFLLPVIRRAGTTVGREALSTGERILDKIAEGENVKETVISEGKKGIDTLLEKGKKQFGSGAIKRRRKRLPTPIHQTIVGRTVIKPPIKKKKRIDTFGLY